MLTRVKDYFGNPRIFLKYCLAPVFVIICGASIVAALSLSFLLLKNWKCIDYQGVPGKVIGTSIFNGKCRYELPVRGSTTTRIYKTRGGLRLEWNASTLATIFGFGAIGMLLSEFGGWLVYALARGTTRILWLRTQREEV